jgi:hypothetical protein
VSAFTDLQKKLNLCTERREKDFVTMKDLVLRIHPAALEEGLVYLHLHVPNMFAKYTMIIHRFQNSAGAGSNYNEQFLYISAIAFDKTRIYIKEDVLSIQGYVFQQF